MASGTRTRLVKFETKQAIKRSRNAVSRGMADTAVEMTKALTKVLGKQGTSLIRSKPGEPPRRQSGLLQLNTRAVKTGKGVITVRTLQYGLFLEPPPPVAKGLSNRPWLRSTIHDRRRFWVRRINANIRKHAK